MKTIICLVAGLMLVAGAVADPNRYESRAVGVAGVHLQPLFAWWTFASQTTNAPVDITDVDREKLEVVSNIWLRLPPRPLPDWVRITASEDQIAVVGNMWKVDAMIQPAPMIIKHEVIYLKNPPVKEIQDFKLARTEYLSLQNAQSNDVAAEQLLESNIQVTAEAEAAATAQARSNASAFGQPGAAPQPYRSEVVRLEGESSATTSNLNYAHARTQSRDAAVATAERYLATFPDKNVYWLDHFALRTGKTVDGLEVYDLGTAPGLTY